MEYTLAPTEDLALDPAFDVVPRFELDGSGLNGLDPPLDFRGPRGFGVRVRGTVQALQELGCQFGARVNVEADGLSGLEHIPDSTCKLRFGKTPVVS